jgi:hypothetical protein
MTYALRILSFQTTEKQDQVEDVNQRTHLLNRFVIVAQFNILP